MRLEVLDRDVPAMTRTACDIQAEMARLSDQITWYEGQAKESVQLVLHYKIEIGKRLKMARVLLPHGKFLSWAQAELGWTPRHVQNHLKLAEHANRVSQLPPDTSLRMALAAIKDANTEVSRSRSSHGAGTIRRICIVGEIQQGSVDKEQLMAEIKRMTAEIGALESTCKTRSSWRRVRKAPCSADRSRLERN